VRLGEWAQREWLRRELVATIADDERQAFASAPGSVRRTRYLALRWQLVEMYEDVFGSADR
jgi:hypothetical protein